MRGFLLDTFLLAEAGAPEGAEAVKSFLAEVEEPRLFVSALLLADYDRGIAMLADDDPRRTRYQFARNAITARFRDRVVPLSDRVVALAGAIRGRMRRDLGRAPGLKAALLAASSIDAGLYLATRAQAALEGSGAVVFDPFRDRADDFPLVA